MKRSTGHFKPTWISVVLWACLALAYLNVKECRGEEGEEEVTRRPPRLSAFLRRLSEPSTTTSESPVDFEEVTTWRPKSIRSIVDHVPQKPTEFQIVNNSTSQVGHGTDRSRVRLRTGNPRRRKPLPESSKILGVDEDSNSGPEDLIRTALINHTLEHGGEEDLDKLVFSALPQGSKLILRTVRIIKTDENGEPVDESETKQPTYWDITLANATDQIVDDEEEEENVTSEEGDDEGEKGPGVPEHRTATGTEIQAAGLRLPLRRRVVGGNGTVVRGRKKPDLLSSGSHSSENYHLNNDYGTVGREKEHGKTHYHGNTHGKTHKQTYTDTDGKDIKPYHGTEKGVTDYANGHGSDNKNQGERFKSSKRKNKGRKVTGFKRVYHKEEFQRTEHFYDDEEAKKIAESFGLSEAKESNDGGTKGDKRKYHGVRTEYLDGKQHKDEHGIHDGYDKGQRNTYKDSEKHSHKSNYGKSMSHNHGDGPHHHQSDGGGYHNHRQHGGDYHPNHNYHASYSNPQKNTVSSSSSSRLPTSITDKIEGLKGGVGAHRPPGSYAAAQIISAPIASSFSVTEFPIIAQEAASTPDPSILPVLEHAMRTYPPAKFTFEFSNYSGDPEPLDDYGKGSDAHHDEYDDGRLTFESDRSNGGRRYKGRKESHPHEKKIYSSPKHREVKEEVEDGPLTNQVNGGAKYTNTHFQPIHVHSLPYQIILPTRGTNTLGVSAITEDDYNTATKSNSQDKYPYAPNFATQQHHRNPQPSYGDAPGLLTHQAFDPRQNYRHQKTWRWPRRRLKPRTRPPSDYPPSTLSVPGRAQMAPAYPNPRLNQVRLAAIPMRHATAYHRLGNRLLRYHPPHHRPHNLNYVEMSTRKSDDGVSDSSERNNGTNSGDDVTAHYFNHNIRYAKNHLTSTIHPLSPSNIDNSGNGNGVRNTLFGQSPGVYSTIIKVLPATMLSMNGSRLQQGSGSSPALSTSDTGSGTKRPQTFADLISITTAFPNLIPQPQQFRPQRLRPFLPRNRWTSFNLPYANPNPTPSKPNYGPDFQHPFTRNVKRIPNLMRGIRNGIMRTFSRGMPHVVVQTMPMSHPQNTVGVGASASPTTATGQAGAQASQLQKLPVQVPTTGTRYLPLIRGNPYFRQMFAQVPVSVGNYMGNYHGGILPLGSRDYLNTVLPPTSFSFPTSSTPSPATVEKKPKFYYTSNASEESNIVSENKMGIISNSNSSNVDGDGGGRGVTHFKLPLKVASIPTLAIPTTPAGNTVSTEIGLRSSAAALLESKFASRSREITPTQPAPVPIVDIEGLFDDSPSEFVGKRKRG